MKAVVVDHYIKNVREVAHLIKDFPEPVPKEDEALVEIKYCALNFYDSTLPFLFLRVAYINTTQSCSCRASIRSVFLLTDLAVL
jgi:hypothetical protein